VDIALLLTTAEERPRRCRLGSPPEKVRGTTEPIGGGFQL